MSKNNRQNANGKTVLSDSGLWMHRLPNGTERPAAGRVPIDPEEVKLMQAARAAGILPDRLQLLAAGADMPSGDGRRELERLAQIVDSPEYRPDPASQRYMAYVAFRNGLRPGTMADHLMAALEHVRGTYGPSTSNTTGKRPGRGHSDDFRSVNWYGTEYAFTAGQSAIVKILWASHENGTPDVGADTLIEVSGSGMDTGKVRSIFAPGGKVHPAWDVMIVKGKTKGSLRLSTK